MNYIFEFLGARRTSFTLAWMASHRDRLRGFFVGGSHLTIAVIWDTNGNKSVERSDADLGAIRQIVHGDDLRLLDVEELEQLRRRSDVAGDQSATREDG